MLADERRWRQRVPLTGLRALLVFGLGALLAIETVLADPPCSIDPGCRQPLRLGGLRNADRARQE